MKKNKKISKTAKIFLFGFLFILICFLTSGIYFYSKVSNVTDKKEIDALQKDDDYKLVDGITNILLIGIDARNINEQSRSDAMMILTVDSNSESIKMTSLARDTYVNIPGYGMEKLTHAYAYGGANLLLETIESNFELDINHYSVVNFNSFIDIIDAVGGIEIDIQKKDLKELNKIIKDSYNFKNENNDTKQVELIESEGLQELNGYQVLAYSRMRKHDSAFNRDERQREVLESLITKLKKLPITKYNSLLNALLPNVKTDMLPKDILNLGFTILSISNLNIEKLEFPLLDYSDGGIKDNDGWVLDFKRELCLKVLHDFIFENKIYTGDELKELNEDIESSYNSEYNNYLKKSNKKDSINDDLSNRYNQNIDLNNNDSLNNYNDDILNSYDNDLDSNHNDNSLNNYDNNLDSNHNDNSISDNYEDIELINPSEPIEPTLPVEPKI